MEVHMYDPSWGTMALSFAATIPMVVTDPCNISDIKTFGSGFFLIHRGHMFFVTADHVIHPDDHDNDTGQRSGIEYLLQIITGIDIKQERRSRNIPLGGFYDHTEYVFDDDSVKDPEKLKDIFVKIAKNDIDINDESLPLNVAIPNLIDIAVCKMTKPPGYILNREVRITDDEVLVPANTLKVPLSSDSIVEFNKDDFYIVAGNVRNNIVNSMNLTWVNVVHPDMKFEKYDDGDAVLSVWGRPNIDDWSGLSGAPVFNCVGGLAGMLVYGPDKEPFARVVPIKTIIEYIDKCIAYEFHQ